MTKVMSKEDTERFFLLVASAAFADRAVDEAALEEIRGTHIDPQHLEAAAQKVMRIIASHMNEVPDRLKADFETTEKVRFEVAKVLADQVLLMKQTFLSLTRPKR